MKKIKENKQNPAFYALLVALVVMSIGPILLMIMTSFKQNVDIMNDMSGLFFTPTLQNYETVLCDVLWYEPEHVDFCSPTFTRSLGNSIFIALVSTAITLIIGCMAAYSLVRFRFMGRGVVSLTTLMMRMVPPAVLLVPVFGIWTFDYQLDGTYSGIILLYVAMKREQMTVLNTHTNNYLIFSFYCWFPDIPRQETEYL